MTPRLTSLAHGGGCGCKLAPAVLQNLLAGMPAPEPFRQLLVGSDTADDAAVWQIDENTCLIATTDFFMPVVDDPRDFGRIAATNAISDIYAMGGRPIMALAIVGMPIGKLDPSVIRQILAGGAETCADAGIPVAGGHSIDSQEPIYGLAVMGLCHPSRLRTNAMAKPGDAVILTKALGVGIYSAAIKQGLIDGAAYSEMVGSTTLLNRAGAELAKNPAVHALTDVTGFGLLGHALEVARASRVTVHVDAARVPFLDRALDWTKQGVFTGASTRNWASYGMSVACPETSPDWLQRLLTDPQTSGGLLVTCTPEAADSILSELRASGHAKAAIIGCIEAGEPVVHVEGVPA